MSQTFADRSQFETLFTQLFDRISAEGSAGIDDLITQRMVICFRVRKPDVELWVDGRTSPIATAFTSQELDATLTVELSGDSLDQLLLGTLSIANALLFRKAKVKGSKSKAIKLENLLHAMQDAYPEISAEVLGR
ncbi:MAG: SCP2 sterol-binding domain-containing protein [Ilumatobacter sp.]